ncbi:hypothetical protein V6N11_072331 [Hibiscus sabdariffa]|uniref:PB1-like domain-containing protein n=1 Tax=Hibiscus sabdariffa TaxID=183260 RepID=A0ABR2U2S4_9ROSI
MWYTTPSLLYTGQFVDYFDNCDVDEMSMFEVMGMVESLGLTYTMKMYWLVSNNPFQVKTLGSDKDILEMLSNIPRDHYVHVYLEEVRPYQFNVVSVEPNDEPSIEESLGEPSVEENFVEPETNDNVDEEHSVEVNIGKPRDDGNVADSNSDSEDIDYEVFKSTSYESGFTDTENDLENESDSEGVGDNVTREESHRHNRKVSDEIMVDNDPESGHYDSFHSLDEADSDGPHKKPRYPEFNTTTDISNPIFKVRRGSGTNEHQDTVTTSNQPQPPSQPSPPSQPAPADQTVRWMSTPTTQNNFATQSGREHQGNIPRASQLPPPSQPPPAIHIVRLMPTPNHSGEFCHSIISKAILNTPRINVLIFL